MPSRKKLSPLALVALLFFACTIVYGLLSSYPRQLAVYSDELRYLDVARSLLAGRGLRVRNMPSDYQKILYPLCILPALLLKSTAAQITAIGWLNAAYMASAVFPAYALANTIRMNPHRTVFLVGVTAVLPTMSAASTFMSETVFLPLSLWQVYFFLRAMLAAPRARIGWCAAAGAFCYLLYLNKEVALYYLIAWVLVRAWVWWHDKASWKAELAATAALLGSFLACFLLAKATLFRGLGNSYNQTSWLNAEQWRFLPFALACDALFTVLAFWVFPVLLPICGLHRPRKGSDARRTQLPLFLLLSLAIGVAVIAWSITVREDLKLLDANENLSVTKAAVFCAMDYLDEYRKSTGSAENMRSQIQDYIADAARAKLAEDKAKAENEVLRREAAALREQLEKMRSKEARREERAQQAAQQTAGRSEDAEQKG